jgi:hypothetical protein
MLNKGEKKIYHIIIFRLSSSEEEEEFWQRT